MDAIAAVVALFFGALAVGGATITGEQEALCEGMGGTFTPSHTEDVCPGGTWRTLIEDGVEAKP